MNKKFLGLRLCDHDSNISYFDGKELHYYKLERDYQIKHHRYHNFWRWKEDIKKIWNISVEDIDEIGIVADPQLHPTKPDLSKMTQVNHHLAHTLSCFPIKETPFEYDIVIDGFGDQDISFTAFKNLNIVKEGKVSKSGSLGIEYTQAGLKLGIQGLHLDIPGKLMALQSLGQVKESFLKVLSPFDIYNIKHVFNFNLWIQHCKSELIASHTMLDWIASVHKHIENILLEFFDEITGKNRNTCITYSGGCALNIVWNTFLKNHYPNLIIPPHAGDEGLSLGIIEYLRRKHNLPKIRIPKFPFIQSDVSPSSEPTHQTLEETADLLSKGKIVGWYQGHGEIGPRALGHRSILLSPFHTKNAKEKMNTLKQRESFRPFGASVLKNSLDKYFKKYILDSYMLFTSVPHESNLKSITHFDNTSRIQVAENNILEKLLQFFEQKTGESILMNTSLNVNGMPLMHSPEQAKEFFKNSSLDVLVIGKDILKK